ncbi:MAG TPA: 50S ribosomal protein L21 [Alphaproteobacteria bacterium]|nr:50S ribosomal protein L21 [Alphaproteobacteria bacterium]
MYAVIRTGGKQYRVAPDEVLKVERLEAETGGRIAFDQVLAVDAGSGLKVGTPIVSGAMVTATVLEQTHAPTVIVFKKKRRHNYRRKKGHRQDLTVIRIREILTDGRQPSPEPEAAERGRETKKTPAKTTAKAKPATGKAKPAKKAPAKPAAKAKSSGEKAKPAAKKSPAKKPARKKKE